MSNEVTICNDALGAIGDPGTVVSLYPPEGSAQAERCAASYPNVRDSLLEAHDWTFATRRALLAEHATNPAVGAWAYCFVAPADLLKVQAVYCGADDPHARVPYSAETGGPDNAPLIYTNTPGVSLRYTARLEDTTRYSPGFIACLTMALSARLAGPIIKGAAGMRVAALWEEKAFGRDGKSGAFGRAVRLDANQTYSAARAAHVPSWVSA